MEGMRDLIRAHCLTPPMRERAVGNVKIPDLVPYVTIYIFKFGLALS